MILTMKEELTETINQVMVNYLPEGIDIFAKERYGEIQDYRYMLMNILYCYTSLNYKEIGLIFNRHISSVAQYAERCEDRIFLDQEYKIRYNMLKDKLLDAIGSQVHGVVVLNEVKEYRSQ